MNHTIKIWMKRIIATGVLIAGLLLIIILNPILTYAHKTAYTNFDVYHNQALDKSFYAELNNAHQLIAVSELYNPRLRLDICLNDGSAYPTLIGKIRGQAFASGFYDKVVVQGTADYQKNCVELNGYKWNLTQLLAHEMTHCLQFDKLGLWRSRPVANVPDWKWEGYAEYIARQNGDQKDIIANLDQLLKTNSASWEVVFADGTIAPRAYYSYWTLVQYCMDIKKMTYLQILASTTSEEDIKREMMDWYKQIEISRATSLLAPFPASQAGRAAFLPSSPQPAWLSAQCPCCSK
jgi:hypothetical protein